MSSTALSRSDRIRVFVAESNPMASQMMESVLLRSRQNFEVQTFTTKCSQTLEELEKSEAHVALISADLQDGPLSGFHVLRHIQNAKLNTAPIMLLNCTDQDLLIDSFRCGARGIFTRTQPIDDLPKCICAVHSGQLWVSNEQIELLLDLVSRLRPLQVLRPGGMALLTVREREVIGLVAEGMTNNEISQKLRLSEHTVRNYICHISEKLGLSSRVELVLYALSR